MLYGYSLQYKVNNTSYRWITKNDYTNTQEARSFMFEAKDNLTKEKTPISYVIFRYTSIHDSQTVERGNF